MRTKTILLIGFGFLFLALGAVGLLIPVWPTTPFVLVSAACFARTPRIKAQIMQISFFKEHIENYENRAGLSRKTIIISLCYLWGMLLLSMFLIQTLWILLLLFCVGIAVTIHILWMAKAKRGEPAKTKRLFGIFEAVVDILYLVVVLLLGLNLLFTGAGGTVRMLAGIMALVLASGDAFHLLPRVNVIMTHQEEALRTTLGQGKQIASITMTLFYVILWQIGLLVFSPSNGNLWSYIVYFLAAVRILLCLLPQNRWQEPHPPVRWGIFRNIPFFLLGVVVAGLYFVQRNTLPELGGMWLAIALSFAFYLPVVLFSNRYPKIGMLMLPKIGAYLWMLMICQSL